jgi:DNA-binding NtrC family response regulator
MEWRMMSKKVVAKWHLRATLKRVQAEVGMHFKVVYIDDEVDLCDIFKESFEATNLAVDVYSDPEMAIQAINANPPGLVFIDFRLPNMTGEQVAQRIPAHLPKVLITGELTVGPSANFLRVFHKPFRFGEVQTFINQYAAKRPSHDHC